MGAFYMAGKRGVKVSVKHLGTYRTADPDATITLKTVEKLRVVIKDELGLL